MKKTLFSLICLLLLSGCQQKEDYDYLMSHPQSLRHAIANCQSTENQTEGQSADCELIAKAARDMDVFIAEEQADPEKFGQRILDVQMTIPNTKAALIADQQALASQQSAAIDPALTARITAERASLKGLTQDLAVRLAVLSLGTPGG